MDLTSKQIKAKENEIQRILEEQIKYISKQDMSRYNNLPQSTIEMKALEFVREYFRNQKVILGSLLVSLGFVNLNALPLSRARLVLFSHGDRTRMVCWDIWEVLNNSGRSRWMLLRDSGSRRSLQANSTHSPSQVGYPR